MNYKKIKNTVFCGLLLTVVACDQDSEFQSAFNGNNIITDDITVQDFCQGKTLKRVQQTLVFSPDTQTCEWGQNGNLNPSFSKTIAAVQSYTQPIDLGTPVASICDFSLSMNETFTVYDDDITFTFDQFAFAGDFLFRDWLVDTAELEQVGNLLRYDRSKVIGKDFYELTPQDWLEDGVTGDFNTRQNDATQREGNFNLQLTKDFLDLMPRTDLTRQVHEFGFHIFGNQNDSDCQHQGFTINVDVSFVPRSAVQ